MVERRYTENPTPLVVKTSEFEGPLHKDHEYAFLNPLLSQVELADHEGIFYQLKNLAKAKDGERAKKALATVLRVESSRALKSQTTCLRVDRDSLKDLLRTPATMEIIGQMLNRPENFRLQLGTLLTSVDINELDIAQQAMFARENSDMEVSLMHSDLFLCADAEQRLAKAGKEGALMLTNQRLLTKFRGKMAAVCLESFSTNKGIFMEGNWYMPTSATTKELLRNSFDEGQNFTSLQEGHWTIMRSVLGDDVDEKTAFLDEAKRFRDSIGKIQYSCDLTRSEYRNKHEEIRQ